MIHIFFSFQRRCRSLVKTIVLISFTTDGALWLPDIFFCPNCCSKVKQIECTIPIDLAARVMVRGLMFAPIFLITVLKRLFRCSMWRSVGILQPTKPLVLTKRSHMSWLALRWKEVLILQQKYNCLFGVVFTITSFKSQE